MIKQKNGIFKADDFILRHHGNKNIQCVFGRVNKLENLPQCNGKLTTKIFDKLSVDSGDRTEVYILNPHVSQCKGNDPNFIPKTKPRPNSSLNLNINLKIKKLY